MFSGDYKRMGQFFLELQTLKPYPCKSIFAPSSSSNPHLKIHRNRLLLQPPRLTGAITVNFPPFLLRNSRSNLLSPFICKSNESDIISQLELGKPEKQAKPVRRVTGVFWIILLNLGIYVADHIFQVPSIQSLYLYHDFPAWYQFITATFCHANWKHLSSNLFFLYIFGKLVEEEEGNFALWLSYIVTGAGANLVSWLVLPRNAVSVGASGAVFGLFAISVLVKISWDWRKILEVLILGHFVVEKVMEAAQASTGLSGSSYALQSVNHIAHLSGALLGVLLVWLLSKAPSDSEPPGIDLPDLQKPKGRNRKPT